MPPPDRAPSRRPGLRLATALALLPPAAGCGGDSLYDAGEVTGPHQGLASHSVALSFEERPSLALGESFPVTVSFDAPEASGGVSRLGATALLIHPSGGDTTVLRASRTLSPPQAGAGSATLDLRLDGEVAAPLPETFRIEVSAFAVAAGGACAAAVEPTPQRLACAAVGSDTVAFGSAGAGREVRVEPPLSVSLSGSAPPRAAEGEALVVARVSARGSGAAAGISALGATAFVSGPTGAVIAVLGDTVGFPGTASASHTFAWTAADVLRESGLRSLPDSLAFELHAFAIDAEGRCVAATAAEAQRLACATRSGATVAAGAAGQRLSAILVRGRSAPLPGEAPRIVDLAIDPRAERAYLSNAGANQVEVLDLATMRFLAPIRVGSQPAGVAFNRTGDTLMVANSGGISISFVPTADLREDVSRRFEIPRVRLYELKDTDYREAAFHSFSDRPMFVEQDAEGRLLYTTATTEAAPVGTIRAAEWRAGWTSWEPYLLFHERALTSSAGWTAVANVDSLLILGADQVLLFDHVPGFPERVLRAGPGRLDAAIQELRGQGSDAVGLAEAKWAVPVSVELSDTSFVAVSGDRRVGLFGEGVRTPGGRLMLWSSDAARLSQVEDIGDVTQNVSDRVRGIDLGSDGSLGAVRGDRGVHFFDDALRLRGTASEGLGSGSGIGLLSVAGMGTLAFAGTDRGTIQVIETTHFRPLGELPLRDSIVGRIELAEPVPGENAGRACSADPLASDPACVVARLVALTAGGVASIEIRAGDLQSLSRR